MFEEFLSIISFQFLFHVSDFALSDLTFYIYIYSPSSPRLSYLSCHFCMIPLFKIFIYIVLKYIYLCLYVHICVCVCVCACIYSFIYMCIFLFKYIYIYIYIYIYPTAFFTLSKASFHN